MLEQASSALHDALTNAASEAASRGDRRLATDHLLLGLLHNAEIADRLGITLDQARAAASELDRIALAAVGIDLTADPIPVTAHRTRHMPLTPAVRHTMARAFAHAKREHERKVQPRHLLLALLERREPDPAATLCHALNIPDSPL